MRVAKKEKAPTIQKPFRCSQELDIRLNRTKGALMMETGSRISDNQFIIDLLEMGLERLQERLQVPH